MNNHLLDQAIAYPIAHVNETSGDVFKLPLPIQTVAVIQLAQGIIDNGGLVYFYDCNFVGSPRYSFFVDALMRIGAEAAAQRIQASSSMFPFPDAHLHEAMRQQWLEGVKEDESHEFMVISGKACGDTSVFEGLAKYVEQHRDAFASA